MVKMGILLVILYTQLKYRGNIISDLSNSENMFFNERSSYFDLLFEIANYNNGLCRKMRSRAESKSFCIKIGAHAAKEHCIFGWAYSDPSEALNACVARRR